MILLHSLKDRQPELLDSYVQGSLILFHGEDLGTSIPRWCTHPLNCRVLFYSPEVALYRKVNRVPLSSYRAPNVFFEGEELANLDSELVRARHLKCHVCSRRGAALGCFLPRCRHTYHYACSRQLEGCRFDEVKEPFCVSCD